MSNSPSKNREDSTDIARTTSININPTQANAKPLSNSASSSPESTNPKKRKAADTGFPSAPPPLPPTNQSSTAPIAHDMTHSPHAAEQLPTIRQAGREDSATSTNAPCHATTVAIKNLSPSTANNWVLHARVIARGSVCKWENLRGGGTFQEVFLIDKNGDIMRATLFNNAVTNFADETEPGSVCCLSCGKVKFEVAGFSKTKRESHLSLGDTAEIRSINDSDLVNVTPTITFTQFSRITQHQTDALVNIIGILVQLTPTKRVISAQGKKLHKRELVLVDDSQVRVFCTMWGNNARVELDDFEGCTVLIKSGQINDYLGVRSVGVGIGSSLMIAPVIPRATELLQWYAAGVDHASFPVVHSP